MHLPHMLRFLCRWVLNSYEGLRIRCGWTPLTFEGALVKLQLHLDNIQPRFAPDVTVGLGGWGGEGGRDGGVNPPRHQEGAVLCLRVCVVFVVSVQ